MITIERDKYGNILSHLTQDGENIRETIYQYNHHGDMISREAYMNGVLLDRNTIHNEYDIQGKLTYVKDTFYLYDIDSKNVIRTHVNERIYDNIYDANGFLTEVISSYLTTDHIEKNFSYKEKFYYDQTLLVKKEFIGNNIPDIPVFISTYKHDNLGKISEEQVCLENDVLSHYITYKHIEENRYWKTIVGPSRTNHNWMINAVTDDRCELTLYESCCSVELIEDTLTYVLMTYPMVKNVIISVNTADASSTTYKLIDKKIREYEDIHNMWIALIP